jgi:peptide/nickel transport system permease protein
MMRLLRYVVYRLLLVVPLLIGITLLTFTISHVVPGDPAMLAAGPQASKAEIQLIQKEFALDKPLPEQYVIYISNLVKGDWGKSLLSRRPVAADLKVFFPATLELTIWAIVIATVLGIPLGMASAVYRDSWLDHLARVLSLVGVSFPQFFLALILQLILSMGLGLTPLGGRFPAMQLPPVHVTGLFTVDAILDFDWIGLWWSLQHLLLPALALAVGPLATITRMTRAGMLEVLGQDFVLQERASGISKPKILFKYVLKNSFLPVLTMIGLSFGWLLGGAVLVESIFDWPGIGLYAVKSAMSLDFMPIMGVSLLTGFCFIIVNVLVDVLYGLIDPRITHS